MVHSLARTASADREPASERHLEHIHEFQSEKLAMCIKTMRATAGIFYGISVRISYICKRTLVNNS
jgi:hypothetical protein